MPQRIIPLPFALDLMRTLGPVSVGRFDPTMRVDRSAMVRATRGPLGPAAIRVDHNGGHLAVEAWGPGADWALETAPSALGLLDDTSSFKPEHPLVRDLHRRTPGLRLVRTERVIDALVVAILAQRVTGLEAKRSFMQLVKRWGEPAPGPLGLWLLPEPAELAALGYHELHAIGIEKKRADTLTRVCTRASRLEAALARPHDQFRALLESIPGVGAWTSAEVSRVAGGDPDAVSVGDYHLKNVIAFALASEPRGTDERMLELLEPFAGHRGRVCLLIETAGISAPRYGPRQRVQPLARR